MAAVGFTTTLFTALCLRSALGAVVECGSPSSPTTSADLACSGCAVSPLIQGVIDKVLATQKGVAAEKACIAAVAGASTQVKGYPCVTMTAKGGCTISETCAVKSETGSKACIFTMGGFSGVSSLAKCPADSKTPCPATPTSDSTTTGVSDSTTTPALVKGGNTTTPKARLYSQQTVADQDSDSPAGTNMVWLAVGGLLGMGVLMVVQGLRSRTAAMDSDARETQGLIRDAEGLE